MKTHGQAWVIAGVLATVAGVLATLYFGFSNSRLEPRQDVSIFFSDSAGVPRTDLGLLLLDGLRIEPDQDGIVYVPSSRAGEEASVRDRVTRRELCALTIPQAGSEATRVIVPSQRVVRCR
jgi:hypothetical protein